METPYDDIMDQPHHISPRYPRMPMADRAAQFAPFQALAGYGEAIRETGRSTQTRAELTEEEQALLDEKLRQVVHDSEEVLFTYFQADGKKDGGTYLTTAGTVRRVDSLERTVVLTDGRVIPLEDILSIE